MNFLDIILAIPLCYFIYKGWKRGLIFELASLAGIVVGCWAAVHLSTWVAQSLHLTGEGAVLTAFFITFMAAIAGAFFLGKAIEGIFKMVKLKNVNKLLGAALGMMKCLCVLAILLNFVLLVDQSHKIITPKAQTGSVLFKPTYTVGNRLTTKLKTYIDKVRAERAEQNEDSETEE